MKRLGGQKHIFFLIYINKINELKQINLLYIDIDKNALFLAFETYSFKYITLNYIYTKSEFKISILKWKYEY